PARGDGERGRAGAGRGRGGVAGGRGAVLGQLLDDLEDRGAAMDRIPAPAAGGEPQRPPPRAPRGPVVPGRLSRGRGDRPVHAGPAAGVRGAARPRLGGGGGGRALRDGGGPR